MEDFQLPSDILDNILAYFSGPHINEPCGLLVILKGKLKFIPMSNISEQPDTFVPETLKYAAYSRAAFILVHGHSDNCIPSEHDMLQSEANNIPYMIVDQSSGKYTIYWPRSTFKLCGKSYEFGVHDCFELARNWYLLHGIITPERDQSWIDDWWENGLDYISKEINRWPFKLVEDLKYGDLLIFKIGAEVPNHIGVYLGEDIFIHHAVNRLSCKENLYPMWGEHIVGIYRYENSSIRRLSWGEVW